MADETPRKKRKTKLELRYKLRNNDRTGELEAECPSCQQYIAIKHWFVHDCPNPIVKRDV